MSKPKKLIRSGVTKLLKEGEFENITDAKTLNELYALKVMEELKEIQNANHADIGEFADLLQVTLDWAKQNDIEQSDLAMFAMAKRKAKGGFSNIVLNNLNPNNPSNALYFKPDTDFLKYMNHLPTCSKMQNWSEARQALADTPSKFRDADYYEACTELENKMATCTCGYEAIKAPF